MKIGELAGLIGGIAEGDPSIDINSVNGIEQAEAGDLTFALDEERLANAEKSRASCILTFLKARRSSKPLIRVANPKFSFLVVYNIFNTPQVRESFIHPLSSIAKSVIIGKNTWIGPHVYIEDGVVIGDNVIIESSAAIKKGCEIGSSCHIYPNVTLYGRTKLHNNVTLHAGVVVGSDGFGYVKDHGKTYKFPQIGRVIIEADVEIGANTTIDRGSLSDTVIGAGSKIDNLCQIAHNVKIGKNLLMAAQCGISGSTTVGENVTLGGQAGIVDNVVIGNNVTIGAKSAVIGNVKDNTVVWGIPARPIAHAKRQVAVLSWLTKNFKKISKDST